MIFSKLRAGLPRAMLRAFREVEMRWMVVVAAMAITPALAIEDVDGTLSKLSTADRAALVETFDLSLTDGPSARVRLITAIDQRRVCGLVNSKNRMNAYIGYRAFLADLDRGTVLLDGERTDYQDVPAVTALINAACR